MRMDAGKRCTFLQYKARFYKVKGVLIPNFRPFNFELKKNRFIK